MKFLVKLEFLNVPPVGTNHDAPLSNNTDRVVQQVLHLESAVAGITSRVELILEKLGLQGKADGNKSAKNEVSMA